MMTTAKAANGLLMRFCRLRPSAALAAPVRGAKTGSSSSTMKYSVEAPVASSSSSAATASPLPSPFEPAQIHLRTNNDHVATLQLRAYGPGQTLENLTFFTDFAIRAAFALGVPVSRPASLPVRTSLWTVPKGPFVHKKSQENFERRTHKRVIKVWDADAQVVDRWLEFLRIHAMAGVGMRAEVYRHLPLSVGSQMIASARSQLRDTTSSSTNEIGDGTVRASEADGEAVARLAQNIVEQEMAKQDAEVEEVEKLSAETAKTSDIEKGHGGEHGEAQAQGSVQEQEQEQEQR